MRFAIHWRTQADVSRRNKLQIDECARFTLSNLSFNRSAHVSVKQTHKRKQRVAAFATICLPA